MYYFEKDYIMRLIHGVARFLAKMLFNREIEEDGGLSAVLGTEEGEEDDCLRGMVDSGRINAAEDRLFELIASAAWDDLRKAALVISFYDYVNGKDDEFLAAADFSRDEIISGLEDAMRAVNMEIPEWLAIDPPRGKQAGENAAGFRGDEIQE